MSAAQPSTRFWDRVADKYSKRPVPDEAVYQKKLEVTRGYFRPDMQVLEFGCGTGSTAIVHAPFVAHIRAVDVSERMIEIARGKAEAENVTNVTFERSSFDDLAAPERAYDAVLGLSILHLLDDRDAAIARIHGMLQPGGIFVSSTPCLGGLLRFLPLRVVLPVLALFGRVPKVAFFSVEALKASLTNAGFEIDYTWQPGVGKAIFIVVRKPE